MEDMEALVEVHMEDLVVDLEVIMEVSVVDLVEEIYRLAKLLPPEERFSLANQMCRAVVSVPSNIAEGDGRQSDKELKQFLHVAKGSLSELETQLIICQRIQYLTSEQTEKAISLCDEIRRMLSKLIQTY